MITYKIQKTRNPKYPETPYYHGVAVKTGELTMEKLAKRINNSTTVTTADCYAVLKSMKDNIIEALTEGQVVVLEDLGRFQVSLHGKSYSAATMADEERDPAQGFGKCCGVHCEISRFSRNDRDRPQLTAQRP